MEKFDRIEFPVGDAVVNSALYRRFHKLNNIIQEDGYEPFYYDEEEEFERPYKETGNRFLLKLVKTLGHTNVREKDLNRLKCITMKIKGKDDNFISKLLGNLFEMYIKELTGIISRGEDRHLYVRQQQQEAFSTVSAKLKNEKAQKPTQLDAIIKAYIKVIMEKSKWPSQKDIIEIIPNLDKSSLTQKTKYEPNFYYHLSKQIEKRENNPAVKKEKKLILSQIKTRLNDSWAKALSKRKKIK